MDIGLSCASAEPPPAQIHVPAPLHRAWAGVRQVRHRRSQCAFRRLRRSVLREIGPQTARNGRPVGRCCTSTVGKWGRRTGAAHFATEFLRRRGYDPLPYLPVITGRIVGSRRVSERFLWDLRQTAQELVIENHADASEGPRLAGTASDSPSSPYDMNSLADMSLGAVADVPMCEFWCTVSTPAIQLHRSGFDRPHQRPTDRGRRGVHVRRYEERWQALSRAR